MNDIVCGGALNLSEVYMFSNHRCVFQWCGTPGDSVIPFLAGNSTQNTMLYLEHKVGIQSDMRVSKSL